MRDRARPGMTDLDAARPKSLWMTLFSGETLRRQSFERIAPGKVDLSRWVSGDPIASPLPTVGTPMKVSLLTVPALSVRI